jgi:hypothetical protein
MSLQLRLLVANLMLEKLEPATTATTRSTNQKFWKALTKVLSRR